MLRIIAATCVFGLLASPTAMAGQADLILVGAKVLTGDSNRPAAEAVALAAERIRAVGPSAEIRHLAGPRTRIIDLRGRTVIAGLIDAHVHLLQAPEVVDEPSRENFERTAVPKILTGFVVDDPRLLPGALTLYEMEVLHRAGLPTPTILTAATRNGAEALRIIDKVGTITEGKLADLVVLDGDFLQDFSALHRTVAVLKGGRVVHGTLPEH